jgi:hypothetical protein
MATRLGFSTITVAERDQTGLRIDNSIPLPRMTMRLCSGV